MRLSQIIHISCREIVVHYYRICFGKEALPIARRKHVRLTKRFYINAALFAALLVIGFIFRDEYAAVRDAIRADVIGAAKTIASDIQDSDGALKVPSLSFGANSEKLTGHGEKIDSSDTNAPANTGENLQFPAIMYPYRALLNDDARVIYNQVYANALAKNTERFTLVQPVSESVLSDIMNAVYNDHPELFWVDTAYSYGFIKSNSIITVTLTYNATMQNISAAEADFNRIVNTVKEKAKQFSTDIEREKFVHDYLMEKTAYNVDAPMNQSAYSALVLGESVCAGYARALQHILMSLDIPCYYVTGSAAGGDHAWNIIALGSDYYNIDPSWNDAAGTAYGTLNYSYFNLPDSQFSVDHKRSPMSARLPACNGTLMSYGAVYGDAQKPSGGTVSAKTPTYASLGFDKSDIISSLDDYNAYCRRQLIQLGTGTHTLMMVLQNAALMQKVSAEAESKGYIDGYAQEVVNSLELQNCRISLQLSFETLADGYILLKQTVKLTGENPPAATVAPTPAPTEAPTPTAAPTIVVTALPTASPVPTPAMPETPAEDTPVPAEGNAVTDTPDPQMFDAGSTPSMNAGEGELPQP